MSIAALALALALIIAPASSRHRVRPPRNTVNSPPRVLALPAVVALGLVIAILAPTGVAAAVAIVGATVEVRRRRRLRARRRAAEAASLQGALDVLVGELRVGAHPVAAIGVAAEEIDGVAATSLRTIAARARIGADIATGLRDVARQSALPAHWENLAVCWHLAQSHGLAVATLMQTAQRDIVERERFSARVSAGMAGARATAAVLASLPVVGVLLGQLIGADPLGFLLHGGAGGWLLIVGVTLACAGLMWSDRITDGVLR